MLLPLNLSLSAMQTRWKAILDPLLRNQLNSSSILSGVKLVAGSNVVDHLLGRTMQGWSIVDINAAATIYRSAPFNDKTITLTASAPVTVNIEVF